jgi:catechol 2,3-dioxygenase-like lactoylglutathione lyase family enzyme
VLNHVSIGVREVARSKAFYDAALGALGYECLSAGADSLGYGRGDIEFWVLEVRSPLVSDPRSGLHFCFSAQSRAAVEAFHKACIAGGGLDNGRPGLRPDYGPTYYAAFAIDPYGYRIEAFCGTD